MSERRSHCWLTSNLNFQVSSLLSSTLTLSFYLSRHHNFVLHNRKRGGNFHTHFHNWSMHSSMLRGVCLESASTSEICCGSLQHSFTSTPCKGKQIPGAVRSLELFWEQAPQEWRVPEPKARAMHSVTDQAESEGNELLHGSAAGTAARTWSHADTGGQGSL